MNFRLYLLTREIFRLKATKEKSKILTWSNRKWRSVEVGAQSDSIVAHIQCTCPVSQRWRSFNARAQPLTQQVALCQCTYSAPDSASGALSVLSTQSLRGGALSMYVLSPYSASGALSMYVPNLSEVPLCRCTCPVSNSEVALCQCMCSACDSIKTFLTYFL